jgi:DnaA family protein
MHQVPLSLSPAPLPTFASYRPGPNGLAWAHLQSDLPLTAPVYLWGPKGSGKTHLLKALAQSSQAAGRPAGWWDGASTDWAAELGVGDFDPAWSILIFDDVGRLDAQAQQSVFALLDRAE